MSNPLRKMFETDNTVEREGIWVEYAEGVRIKVARAGGANKRFSKVLARLARPHRRAIQTDAIDEKILETMFVKAYAKTVVLGWEGVTKDVLTKVDADAGEELVFNLENCEGVLRAQSDLFNDIRKAADTISYFRAEVLEADSGN